MRVLFVAILGCSPWIRSTQALDWTQYRGAAVDGVCSERIQTNWPATGLVPLWKKTLTNGISSMTVSQGRVFTQAWQKGTGGNTEYCIALDATTGKILWSRPVGNASYPDGGVGDGDGPRSTPVLAGGRVFVLSSYLRLSCFDAASGTPIWTNNLVNYGGSVIGWQNAASPLIEGGLLLVNMNASPSRIAAFRAEDGSLVWRKHNYSMTHATPVPATIHGVRQAIFHVQNHLLAVDPETGNELWRHSFAGYSTSAAASPVVSGDIVYCSAAYGLGSVGVRILKSGTNLQSQQLWRASGSRQIHWSSPVIADGSVYGLFEGGSIQLRCLDLSTGTVRWAEDGFGRGSTLLVNGVILALTEEGDAVLVAADPAGYREIARAHVIDGVCWNSPAISEGRLYVRSMTEMAAYDLSLPAPQPLRFSAVNRKPGALEFTLVNSDGSAVDQDRAARVQIQSSPSPGTPSALWTAVPGALQWDAGGLKFEVLVGNEAGLFFRSAENP